MSSDGAEAAPSVDTALCAASPCPDPSFGERGVLVLEVAGGNNATWADHALAEQPDGKLVLSGAGDSNGERDVLVARLESGGALDSTFGEGGVALIDLGGASEQAKSVSVLPDGKIVASGMRGAETAASSMAAAVRLTSSGKLDQAFGTAGIFVGKGAATKALFNGHARQSDGALVLSGQAEHGVTGSDLFIVRLLADGQLDTTFNGTGYRPVDIGGADEFGHGPKLQPDGKIVLSGSSWVGGDLGFDCAIVRLLPDGRLDPEFGSGGHVLLDVGNATNRCHAFVLPGGRLLAVGHTKGSIGIQPTVARLMPDGSLDSTFGTEGTLLLDLGQPATLRAALALSDGRMLLGGERSNGSDRDFLLVALDAAGRPDQAFANDGEMIVDVQPGADDYVQQLLLDHRGRLLIQGRTKAGDKSTLVVMRLLL